MEKFKAYTLAFVLTIIVCFQGYDILEEDQHTRHQHEHIHEGELGTIPTEYPDRIVATWKDDPATSLSVTWRTSTSITEGKALVGIATPAPNFHAKAETLTSDVTKMEPKEVEGEQVEANYHSVTFSDLKSDTIYAYRVGQEGHWSEWFHVRTASKDPEPFSFIYLGDLQNGILSHGSRAIRGAYSKEPDARFIIHAGDLVNRAHRNVEWARWNRAGMDT
ncbi:MAG: fibronectin type III domain-containing protein [Balneolaceae bacterium]|nr:fibronectin type III domain-containing protein [Balneolaceae bacterium]